MKNWMLVCVMAVCCLAWLPLAAAEEAAVDYKAMNPWSSLNPGSYVVATSSMMGMETSMRTTLKEKNDEGYTLTVEMTGPDGSVMNTSEQTQKWAPDWANTTAVGTETLTVDGKEVNCTIYEYTCGVPDAEGTEGKTKAWVCNEMHITVKTETEAGGMTMVMQAVKVGEEVEAAGTKFSCIRYETQVEGSTTTAWISMDCPGGMVRSETKMSMGGTEMTTTIQVTEIVKK